MDLGVHCRVAFALFDRLRAVPGFAVPMSAIPGARASQRWVKARFPLDFALLRASIRVLVADAFHRKCSHFLELGRFSLNRSQNGPFLAQDCALQCLDSRVFFSEGYGMRHYSVPATIAF